MTFKVGCRLSELVDAHPPNLVRHLSVHQAWRVTGCTQKLQLSEASAHC